MKNIKIRFINILIFTVTLFLLVASCSMGVAEKGSSVSFKLDSQTVQNIRASAVQAGNSSNARAAGEEELFIEVFVHGGYEDSVKEPLEEDKTITLKGVPKGAEVYVEAIAYSLLDGKRTDLYKGQSKPFVIANKENTVMFVMKKVAGVGSGSGQSQPQNQNQEIDYVIYVADSANNGFFLNDGSQARPLDSIGNAIAKIVSLSKAQKADSSKTWTIKLLSNITGDQLINNSFDGCAAGITITSNDSASIKTLGDDSSMLGIQLLTTVPVTIKDLNIYAGACAVVIGADMYDSSQTDCAASLTMYNGTVEGVMCGVEISALSTFKMRGGSVVCTDTSNPQMYSAILMDVGSKIYMSGNSVINVYIPWNDNFDPVCIDEQLTGSTPVATFYKGSNANIGAQVLTTANGIELSSIVNKFRVHPEDASYYIDVDGTIIAN